MQLPSRRLLRVVPAVLMIAASIQGCGGEGTSPVLEAVPALQQLIEHEMEQKGLPALSIALIDDQEIVWSRGFGMADPESNVPATAETVYRVGSVSKLFTDLAVMQAVERGELDLDRPVVEFLPSFRPDNGFDREITLRQLMCHRSGLVREPPVGHYFDATEPTLEATVDSLNQTAVVLEPESRTKYSNAGIAVVGRALEAVSGVPFAEHVRRRVLEPLGMDSSDFQPSERTAGLAKAVMWTYDGRQFEAPSFELGMAPAGSMYSTVEDLGKFVSAMLDGGGAVLEPHSLAEMLRPQFSEPGATSGYGLGFRLGDLDGRRRVGHGGAIYGFATELAFLPEEKLGVVVVTTMDFANAVVGRIADFALEAVIAARSDQPPPVPELSTELEAGTPDRLAGRYRGEKEDFELVARGSLQRKDELWLEHPRFRGRVRRLMSGELIVDDRHVLGPTIVESTATGKPPRLEIEGQAFERLDSLAGAPQSPPERWRGLIGEYGRDHNVLFVYERDGRLRALIEWLEDNLMSEIPDREDTFAFPAQGSMYHDENLRFERDPSGMAVRAWVGPVAFERRSLGGESGDTFRIDPVRPVAELRRLAFAASPPEESGDFVASDLVELDRLEPTIRLDIRYATTNNFMSTVFYRQPRAFLQRPAAEAVVRAHRKLKQLGYGLLIHDAYRPWYVTKMFWDATPQEHKVFVANPANGSRHNRGAAVDLTLYDLETLEPIDMVGGYDEFSARSYPDYPGGTSRQRWHRELLRQVMEAEGFTVYEAEWWHFDYEGWSRFPIQNLTFEQLLDSVVADPGRPAP